MKRLRHMLTMRIGSNRKCQVVRVEQEEDDTCTIVRGILEADVSLDGYVYFEGKIIW